MEPVTLILAALAAGAGTGATEVVRTAVQDAYSGLKSLILQRFVQDPKAVASLEMFETSPDETIASYLLPHLLDHEVPSDPAIVAAAEDLLSHVSSAAASGAGTIAVTGNIVQRADRGGVTHFGGHVGSIITNYSGSPDGVPDRT